MLVKVGTAARAPAPSTRRAAPSAATTTAATTTAARRRRRPGGARGSLELRRLRAGESRSKCSAAGRSSLGGAPRAAHAGPGTLFVKTAASTWGELRTDGGTNGQRLRPHRAADAAADPRRRRSHQPGRGRRRCLARSARRLRRSLARRLGRSSSMRTATCSASTRRWPAMPATLRLAGAGAVTGTAAYRGIYRFDQIVAPHGAAPRWRRSDRTRHRAHPRPQCPKLGRAARAVAHHPRRRDC